jgi:hypothetical protein
MPNSQGGYNNPGTMGYQSSNYQGGYGARQGYNNNPQNQGYQQNNQGYYSQGYMNKGPGSSPPSYVGGHYGQYGMQGNQNNQYQPNNNPNNNQGNNQ